MFLVASAVAHQSFIFQIDGLNIREIPEIGNVRIEMAEPIRKAKNRNRK